MGLHHQGVRKIIRERSSSFSNGGTGGGERVMCCHEAQIDSGKLLTTCDSLPSIEHRSPSKLPGRTWDI